VFADCPEALEFPVRIATPMVMAEIQVRTFIRLLPFQVHIRTSAVVCQYNGSDMVRAVEGG